jgi:hypothetical protein
MWVDSLLLPRPISFITPPSQLVRSLSLTRRTTDAHFFPSHLLCTSVEKCKEYGGVVDVEIASRVIRRDEMEEDMDVDEWGNKIYRKDFTGTYNNPNAL